MLILHLATQPRLMPHCLCYLWSPVPSGIRLCRIGRCNYATSNFFAYDSDAPYLPAGLYWCYVAASILVVHHLNAFFQSAWCWWVVSVCQSATKKTIPRRKKAMATVRTIAACCATRQWLIHGVDLPETLSIASLGEVCNGKGDVIFEKKNIKKKLSSSSQGVSRSERWGWHAFLVGIILHSYERSCFLRPKDL